MAEVIGSLTYQMNVKGGDALREMQRISSSIQRDTRATQARLDELGLSALKLRTISRMASGAVVSTTQTIDPRRDALSRRRRFGSAALTGVSVASGLGVPIGPALNLGFAAYSGGAAGLGAATGALAIGSLGRAATEAVRGVIRLGNAALEAAEKQGNVATSFAEGKEEFQSVFGEFGRTISEHSEFYQILSDAMERNQKSLHEFTIGVTKAANAVVKFAVKLVEEFAQPESPKRKLAIQAGMSALTGFSFVGGALARAAPLAFDKGQSLLMEAGRGEDSTKRTETVRDVELANEKAERTRLEMVRRRIESDRAEEGAIKVRSRVRNMQLKAVHAQAAMSRQMIEVGARRSKAEQTLLQMQEDNIARGQMKAARATALRRDIDPLFALKEELTEIFQGVVRGDIGAGTAWAFLRRRQAGIRDELTAGRQRFQSQTFDARGLNESLQRAFLSDRKPTTLLKKINDSVLKSSDKIIMGFAQEIRKLVIAGIAKAGP